MSILWMTGAKQTLDFSNKRAQFCCPAQTHPLTRKKGFQKKTDRSSLSNPPTIPLINCFPAKEAQRMGSLTWSRSCLPQQGATEEEETAENGREMQPFPTNSIHNSFHTLLAAVSMERSANPKAAEEEREASLIFTFEFLNTKHNP